MSVRQKVTMHRSSTCVLAYLATLIATCSTTQGLGQESYEQKKNIVYGETHGIGLVMDIFVPSGKKNGHAIIDVVSGGWSSSRGKIRDHKRAQLFRIFTEYGYTVFAIRPGSVSKFSGLEMLGHLHQGMQWVKEHAAEYGVSSEGVALVGASAGGHLACLATVTATDEIRPDAVAVFFPPTDLLQFVGEDLDLTNGSETAKAVAAIGFNGHVDGIGKSEVRATLTKLSPARLVTGNEPPFLLIHGDADKVVPLDQSERMLAALEARNVSAKLIVKKNGGHPWFTIHQEVKVMADWLDEQLGVKSR